MTTKTTYPRHITTAAHARAFLRAWRESGDASSPHRLIHGVDVAYVLRGSTELRCEYADSGKFLGQRTIGQR